MESSGNTLISPAFAAPKNVKCQTLLVTFFQVMSLDTFSLGNKNFDLITFLQRSYSQKPLTPSI